MRSLGQTTIIGASGGATDTANQTPTATVIYADRLASLSDGAGWPEIPEECAMESDGYHSIGGYLCYAPAGIQADVDVTVTVKQVSGPTIKGYGIVFRRVAKGNYYLFLIDGNSKWTVGKCVNDSCTKLVAFTPHSAIKGGLNTANTLEVVAKGPHFDFFVNGARVGSADDSTFLSGEVGVVSGDSTECVFTNFIVARPS
jgi:hypothetical protein